MRQILVDNRMLMIRDQIWGYYETVSLWKYRM